LQLIKLIEINPVPEPRQSRRDTWNPSDRVIKYRDFCDTLNQHFRAAQLPENYLLVFYLPMPKSWSKKKKVQLYLTPHQQKPDKDNLEKAFLDGLFSKHHNLDGNYDDSHVWDGRTIKLWSDRGAIAVYQIDCVLRSLHDRQH
jgi:Holliday junction resolvase RusA-like endonuclease